MKYELAIVMPVYNEEECIVSVVKSWRDMVAGLGIRFRLLVFNDGSKDGTAKALEQFADDDCVEVIHKPNSGHGPTILEGYHRAVQLADWVFQTDSDGEMQPAVFPSLWSKRNEFDALFGCREGRVQGLGRKVISACSRLTVRLFFKGGVKDVNTPYRLIRSDLLRQAVEHIPPDTFAPNVIISGALGRAHVRVHNAPVPHQNRRTGKVSIVKWRLWKAAFRSFWQTLRCRPIITQRAQGED